MMHPRFHDAVALLHPGVDFRSDLRVENDGDGPKLAAWNLPGEPPTAAEIDALLPVLDAPPVPLSVPAAAAKIALLRAGLLDKVRGAVATWPAEVGIWFSDAVEWHRGNAYIEGLGVELDLDDATIDKLFVAAGRLT